MGDHHVLFHFFNTPKHYRVSFYGIFALLLGSMARFVKVGIQSGGQAFIPEGKVPELMSKLLAEDQRKLWRAELAIMIFENGLFYSFLLGMTAGLPQHQQHHCI